MNSLRQMAHILWLFLSWVRVLKWVSLFGILLMVITLGVALFHLDSPNMPKAAAGVMALGLLFTLGFPFFTSGIIFRKLASSRQFSLIPRANYSLYLGVLIFTLMVSFLPYLAIVGIGAPPLPILPLLIFSAASLFIGFCQLSLPAWSISLLGWTPLVVLQFQHFMPEEILKPLLSPLALWLYIVLSVAGWVHAFFRVRRGFRLRPNSMSAGRIGDSTGWESQGSRGWRQFVQGKSTGSAADSLYNNMLVTWGSRAARIIFPLLALSVMMILMGNLQKNNAGFPASVVLLIISCGASFSLFAQFETLPRSRLLWLRMGQNRQELWKAVESNLLQEYGVLLAAVAIYIPIVAMIEGFTPGTVVFTLVSIACASLFFGYFPLFCRLKPGLFNSLLLFFVSLGTGGAFLVCVVMSMRGENPAAMLILDALLFGFALVFRLGARQRFTTVDWLVVKPRPASRLRPAS